MPLMSFARLSKTEMSVSEKLIMPLPLLTRSHAVLYRFIPLFPGSLSVRRILNES